MRVLRVTGVLLVAALAVSTTGCDTLADRFKPAPKVVTVEAKVASLDATTTGRPLASGRPEGLPLWPGSTVVVSAQTATPQGRSWTAAFTTEDEFEDVVKGYAVGLQNAGWTAEVTDASVGEEQTSLVSATGRSGDALVTVARSADTSRTNIDVVVTPK